MTENPIARILAPVNSVT